MALSFSMMHKCILRVGLYKRTLDFIDTSMITRESVLLTGREKEGSRPEVGNPEQNSFHIEIPCLNLQFPLLNYLCSHIRELN